MLLFYVSLLVLGSWREEIRPSFLEKPQLLAKHLLGKVGIVAGQGVFSTGDQDSPLITAHQFVVRGVDRRGRELRLDRGEDEPPRGLLLFTSQERVFLARLMMALHTLKSREDKGLAYKGPSKMRRILKTFIQHFRWQARRQGSNVQEMHVLWTLHGLDSGDYAPRSQDMVYVHWRANDDALQPIWYPTPDHPALARVRDP